MLVLSLLSYRCWIPSVIVRCLISSGRANLGAGTLWSRIWFAEGVTQILHTSVAQLKNWLNSCLPRARSGLYSQSVLVTTQLSYHYIFPQGSIKSLKWGQGNNKKEMLRFLQNCLDTSSVPKPSLYLYSTYQRHASDRKVVPKRSRIIVLCSNNAITSWPRYVLLFTTLSYKFGSLMWSSWRHV